MKRQTIPRATVAVALVLAVVWTVVSRDSFDVAAVGAWVQAAGLWAPIAFMSTC